MVNSKCTVAQMVGYGGIVNGSKARVLHYFYMEVSIKSPYSLHIVSIGLERRMVAVAWGVRGCSDRCLCGEKVRYSVFTIEVW